MAEKNIIVDGLEFNYNGLLDVTALLRTIDKLIKEREYIKSEKRRSEIVTSKGKDFSIELRPVKNRTAWEKLMLRIKINITGITEVDVIIDHAKQKMSRGNVNIIFDAWKITDWEARWSQKPWFYVLRTLFEKAFYRIHTDKYANELIDDTHHIFNNVKAHLNLHRF